MRATVEMTPHTRSLPLFLLLACAGLAGLALACGGGGDGSSTTTGALTDPARVPTATPWKQPPEVIILDPDNLTPISGGAPTPEQGATPGEATPEPGVCGPTYTVVAGDSFSLIAEKCGVRLQDIIDANPGVDPAALSIGQVIKIPQ